VQRGLLDAEQLVEDEVVDARPCGIWLRASDRVEAVGVDRREVGVLRAAHPQLAPGLGDGAHDVTDLFDRRRP
jgi:hypothetical protein